VCGEREAASEKWRAVGAASMPPTYTPKRSRTFALVDEADF